MQLAPGLGQLGEQRVGHLWTLVQVDASQLGGEQVVGDVRQVGRRQHVVEGEPLDHLLLVHGRQVSSRLVRGAGV